MRCGRGLTKIRKGITKHDVKHRINETNHQAKRKCGALERNLSNGR